MEVPAVAPVDEAQEIPPLEDEDSLVGDRTYDLASGAPRRPAPGIGPEVDIPDVGTEEDDDVCC